MTSGEAGAAPPVGQDALPAGRDSGQAGHDERAAEERTARPAGRTTAMTTDTAPAEAASAESGMAVTAPAGAGMAVTGGTPAVDVPDRVAGSAEEPVAPAKAHGPGRTLVAVYAVFAVAATSRAVVQIITKFHEAPVAYLLSALAGVIYILATAGLSRPSVLGRRIATGACAAELTGVLTVGTLSVVDRGLFPDAAVWSGYGEGYVFLPLILPVLGLWWLRRLAGRDARPAAPTA